MLKLNWKNMKIGTEPRTLLDLPIEEQKRHADSEGLTLEKWQEEERKISREFAAHEAKMTGYMDEETSKRFLKKMMSATQDVD